MKRERFHYIRASVLACLAIGALSPARAQITGYVCAQGALHHVSDLKGGDLPQHQTGDGYTCLAAYKPSGSGGDWTCNIGSLHLVSDLKGGVLPQHQVGEPPHTCLQGSLPACASGWSADGSGAPLTAGRTCVGNLK